MKSVPLTAYTRTAHGRLDVKKLRTSGRVPASIYGGQSKPQNLEIAKRELDDLINHSVSENLLIDLKIEGDAKPQRLALVQEIQHYPLDGKILHLDLHEVDPNEKVTITVPVETKGESVGVKNGGVLEHTLHKIRVKAFPKDLPEVLFVDISALELNQTIHLGDLPKVEGVEFVGNAKITVVSVAPPREEKVEEVVATAPGDVVATKEKAKEGDAAAAPAAGAAPAKKEGGDKGKK